MNMRTIKPDNLIGQSLTAFIKDVGNQFQVSSKDQARDTAYLLMRHHNEGLSFVTKTLPSFGKHFDSALKAGQFSPFPSFKKDRTGALPLFLRGLTKRIFATDGTLLGTADCDAVRLIRQIAYMFYKLEGDYPKELVDETIDTFVRVDEELGTYSSIVPKTAACIYHASLIIKQIFTGFDPSDISPRPGPGQNATKVPVEERYEPGVLYNRLHSAYPYYAYYYMGTPHLLDSVRRYKSLTREESGQSVLTTVPKDSRGPRIICMEPPEYMWFQQGLGRAMMTHIEHHPLTRGHVNFTDQTINGKLALEGSSSGLWATLDMKEASDRIGMYLVELLFDEVPDLCNKLLASVTSRIKLPNGDILEKNKYAPMGSALCFPVMSVVHFALGVAAMHVATGESYRALAKDLYVYGDDLIVRPRHVGTLFEQFPVYGLKFNQDKCCFTGSFRESCGIDAFRGVDVTPQRVKTYTISRANANAIRRHFAMFHGFFNRGLWNLAGVWRERIESTCGWFPCVSESSPALGWCIPKSHLLEANEGHFRYDDRIQSLVLKARCIIARPFASMIGCWERLVRQQVHVKQDSTAKLVKRSDTKIVSKRIPLSSL